MLKHYIVAEDVLFRSPYALQAFDDNYVYVTDETVRKMAELKSRNTSANEFCKILAKLRDEGLVDANANLDSNVTVRIVEAPDVIEAAAKITGDNVVPIVVTGNVWTKIQCDSRNIKAENYRSEDAFIPDYSGRKEIAVSSETINEFYENGRVNVTEQLRTNEFVVMKSGSGQSALGRFDGKAVVKLLTEEKYPMKVHARNVGQRFAIEALLAPAEIAPLVILKGPAGTAKTFLSIACGLEQTAFENSRLYNRILLTRPNIKFDEDIGYLKGSEQEKIEPLIRPFLDNLEVLYRGSRSGLAADKVKALFDNDIINTQAMAYFRGRSIPDTYIIVDEAQNLTPIQAYGLVTRAGVNSKIVLCGDPLQIDNPKVDENSNGLSFISSQMIGDPLCWQIGFAENECERSALAASALKTLKIKGIR